MRYFRTAHAPDECVRRIRLAVRAERGSREPVEGWVLGRTFRLVLQEPITSMDDARGVGCVIYGHIREDGAGSVVCVREFARALDPGLWVMMLPFLIMPFLKRSSAVETKLCLLAFYAFSYLMLAWMYRKRRATYEFFVVRLRRFVLRVLDAKEE